MAAIDLPQSPNVFHPEKPSAVGSRNSLAQEFRDQQSEVDQLLSEEVDKVMNHISSRLPKESLERLDVMGGLKEKVYNYFNQNFQNMFNRYTVTSEDEMVKKVRNFIDREETKVMARYTPKEIASLLDQVGGADKFNTGEIEKSIINMYGHLQGHIQRGVNDLENLTNSLLRQKTDVGAFIRGENAYSIVKCAFKDNVVSSFDRNRDNLFFPRLLRDLCLGNDGFIHSYRSLELHISSAQHDTGMVDGNHGRRADRAPRAEGGSGNGPADDLALGALINGRLPVAAPLGGIDGHRPFGSA